MIRGLISWHDHRPGHRGRGALGTDGPRAARPPCPGSGRGRATRTDRGCLHRRCDPLGRSPRAHRRARHDHLRRAGSQVELARAGVSGRWADGPATGSRSSVATIAASPMRRTRPPSCGLRSVYMNTEFAGPQIEDVCRREDVKALVFDQEYDDRAPAWCERHYRAWTDDGSGGSAQATLGELIDGRSR